MVLIGLCGSAQVLGAVRFGQLGIADGRSQSSVEDILQNRDGYLWFAAEDGLNHYENSTSLISLVAYVRSLYIQHGVWQRSLSTFM